MYTQRTKARLVFCVAMTFFASSTTRIALAQENCSANPVDAGELAMLAVDEAGRFEGDQTDGEVVTAGIDAQTASRSMSALHASLMSRDADQLAVIGNDVELDAAELASISGTSEANEGRLLKVGVEKSIGARVAFGSAMKRTGDREADGIRLTRTQGEAAWGTRIGSQGATAMRVHFTGVALPEGAAIYVYNATGQAFGPYDSRMISETGDLWSNTVFGPEIRIQLVTRGAHMLEQSSFSIAEVALIGDRFQLAARHARKREPGLKSFCALNAPCVVNAECVGKNTLAEIDQLRGATGHYIFQYRGDSYICSGGLVNDTVKGSTIPYFITANHCMATQAEATSMEAFWQYTTPCGSDCYDVPANLQSNLGATLLATSTKGDFTFLRFNAAVPANQVMLGWTASPIAFSYGRPLLRISHPQGSPQSFSRHSTDLNSPTCDGVPLGDFIYSVDKFGATEGGSSGSVVVNSKAQIVGQLTGSCGEDPDNVCEVDLNRTVDGAFATYYSKIKKWLSP